MKLARDGWFGVLVGLLLAGSMWFYVQNILIGQQQVDANRLGIPRGNLSDLYPRWVGTKELLLHHRDPYDAEITREIQAGYYGRPLDPARPNDPRDEQGFVYPVYVAFLLAPTVGLPFPAVQALFRWILILLTAASVLMWLRILEWHPPIRTRALLLILTLGSFPFAQGLKLQQLSLLVAGLVAVSAVLLISDHLTTAGVVLGVATIKPQLVLPVAAFLLMWALSDWGRRKRLVLGFAGAMLVQCAGAEFLLPGWFGRFERAVAAYRAYNGGAHSTLEELLTPAWGTALSVLIVLFVAVLAWRCRRMAAGSVPFSFVLTSMLAITVLIVRKASPYNQILLLPGILFAAQHWEIFCGERVTRTLTWLATALVIWPWIAAAQLCVMALFTPLAKVEDAWALPLYTSLLIPVAVAGLLGLKAREFCRPPAA